MILSTIIFIKRKDGTLDQLLKIKDNTIIKDFLNGTYNLDVGKEHPITKDQLLNLLSYMKDLQKRTVHLVDELGITGNINSDLLNRLAKPIYNIEIALATAKSGLKTNESLAYASIFETK